MWSWDFITQKRNNFTQKFENFLVLDIETVTDKNMLENIGEEKDLEKLENGEFVHFPFHKIVALSCMIIKNKNVETFKTFASNNESFLIKSFWENFQKAHEIIKKENKPMIKHFPVLITINGKSFDIPTIKVRTLKHIKELDNTYKKFISIFLDKFDKWEQEYPRYTNRNTFYHIDIPIDIFGNKISLKKLAYLCNIPVKQEGDGTKVEEFYNKNDLERIARYCQEDVKATALLFAYINEHLLFNTYKFPNFEKLKGIQGDIHIEDK